MKEDFMSFASGQISDSLGVNTFVKIKKKRSDEKYKQKFIDCIYMLEASLQRSLTAAQIGIDLVNYESTFWEVIDSLLFLLFKDEEIVDAVSFYIYERIDPDGEIIPFYDKQLGDDFVLNTPEDLWDLIIQKVQAKENAKSKTNK